jgi:hypothetical protein
MSNWLQKGVTAEPALQSAISKRSVVAVLLPAEAAAVPIAKLNALPTLTRELAWRG